MQTNKQDENISIYEASEFWDEHDFGEFDDVKESDEVQFSIKKKKYVGIDKDLYEHIKNKAKELKTPEETLINEWLSEKVDI